MFGGVMRRWLFALALLCALAPQRADALLCTPILGCTCNVVASDIDFQAFTPSASHQDAIGQVEVQCTGVIDVAPSVVTQLDDGVWGTFTMRKMRAGSDELSYNLFTTSQRNVVWGNGTLGSVSSSVSGGLITLGTWRATRTVYARAYPTPTTKPGSYSDTVVVRIVW